MKKLESLLKKYSNKKRAEISQSFFKTGKGEYGEGDIFVGVTVPNQRKIAKECKDLTLRDIQTLLNSKIHEKRLISLFILIEQYKKSDEKQKEKMYTFYLNNAKKINNWDLVDSSAHKIVGDYLYHTKKSREIIYKLSKSKNIWERRIAIISTAKFIYENEYDDTIRIAKILVNDKHDLIHKAVGWMLREVGKKDQKILENFLTKHYKKMPRTMLRYAIERIPEKKRKQYLKGDI